MAKKRPAKRSTPVVVKPRPTQSPSRSLGNENRVDALATALGGFQQRLVDLEEMNDMLIKRVTEAEERLSTVTTINTHIIDGYERIEVDVKYIQTLLEIGNLNNA